MNTWSVFERTAESMTVHAVVSGVLIFLFVLSPVSPLIAEAAVGNSPTDVGKNSFSSQYLVSPVSPNLTDGSFQYTLDIDAPPGRNGLEPNLALVYSSNQQETSIVGKGWSVNIPYIERRNYAGVDELFNHDAFFSSLSGNLASTTTSTIFKPEIDSGESLQYRYSSDSWTVYDKNGITYKFGHATTTRLYDGSDTSKIYRWMLEEVRDTNDNYISYTYTHDGNQIYPDVITYTGHDTTDGDFTIRFTKTARSDTTTSYRQGFAVDTDYIITEIKAEVDGSWVRKYALSHSTADNGRTKLLTSVTESAYDGTSTLTMPAYTFTYQSSTDSWTEDTSWIIPNEFISNSLDDLGTRIADVNGDGLLDMLRSDAQTDIEDFYLNTGSKTWSSTSDGTVPIHFTDDDYVHPGSVLLDMNGDGYIDIAKYRETATSTLYLGTGSGWTEASSTPPTPFSFSDGTDAGVRIADVNGDGLPDIVRNYGSDNKVYVSTGEGWTLDSSWSLPELIIESGKDIGTRILDVNGDGLADVVRRNNATSTAYINTGSGWEYDSTWLLPEVLMNDGVDQGFRFADVNGDGLVDIIKGVGVNHTGVQLNTGAGWTGDNSWEVPVPTIEYSGNIPLDAGTLLADVNGDGMVDIMNYKGGYPDVTYINDGSVPDLLVSVTDKNGGNTTVTYEVTPQYLNGTTLRNPDLPLSLNTVKTITYDAGVGDTWSKNYIYNGGLYYSDDIYNRKFAGFAYVEETDDAGFVTKTYFHQGNSTNSSQGEYNDHPSKIGKVYRIEVYDGSSNLYAKTIQKWDRADRGDGSSFVKLAQSISFSYDGDSDHKEKAESYTYNDSAGTVAEKIDWGTVSGSDNGSFTDTGTDDFTTSITHATGTVATGINFYLPSIETTVDTSSNKVRERKVYYDTLSLGSVSEGNPTKEEQWVSGTTYIDYERTYNTYGLLTQEKDPRDKVTSYVYDAKNLYRATSTNPLSQTIEKYYDYSSGKPTEVTDVNGRIFQTTYDPFDRVLTEKQPDIGTPSTLVTKTAYGYTDTGMPRKVQKTDYLDGSTSVNSHTYIDGFGRKIETRVESEEVNTYTVQDFFYDAQGLLKNESLPFFSTGTTYTGTSSPATSSLVTHYTYDPLERVTAVVNNVGTTTTAYDDWITTVTDSEGNVKEYTKNARGDLTSVVEHNGASQYTTTYAYNGNNKLTKITDALGNVRNFTYDGLGRRLTAEDLHDSADGTYGTWTYTYDAAGNLTSVVDPKSQTINYTYDDLNRILTEDYTGDAGTEVQYGYDSCTEGVGRLCVATSTDAVASYAYNALGLQDSETKTIDSIDYVTTYTHNRLGQVTDIVYPDNAETRYTFNNAGLLETVEHKENGGSYAYIVDDLDYAPTGQVSYKSFANDVDTTYTYDATKLYRLSNISTIATTTGMAFGESLLQYASATWDVMTSLIVDDEVTEDVESGRFYVDVEGTEDVETVYANPIVEFAGQGKQFKLDAVPGKRAGEEARAKIEHVGFTAEGFPKYTARIYGTDVQYRDAQSGTLRDIDVTLTPKLNGWSMTKAPYGVFLERDKALVTYRTGNTELYFAPKTTAFVSGKKKGDVVTYTDAFGSGVDMEVRLDTTVMRKEAVIHDASGLAVVDGYVEVPFVLSANEKVDLVSEVGRLSEEGSITTHGSVEVETEEGVSAYFLPPVAYDANGDSIPIQIRYTKQGGGISLTKLIPEEWLSTATLPVRTDTSVSYNSKDSGDGMLERYADSDWSLVHDSNWATNVNAGAVAQNVMVKQYGGWGNYWITRMVFPFDTSALPDTAIIDSATVSLFVGSVINDDNDGNDFLRLVQTTTASATSISQGDYDNVGAIDNPTAGAGDMDISNISTNDWLTFTLNSTGRGWINTTGYTKLGVREGHDVVDDIISNFDENRVEIGTADRTGTTYDPVLDITYHLNAAPSAPTSPLTEGQTNPTDIDDSTPEFSVLFQDSDAGDLAVSYQIQVATSTNFGNPYWDSTKTSLPSSVSVGNRTADISYAGSPLASSTPYYWRMKLWDDDDVAGLWTTATSSFSLQASQASASDILQDITYTYDGVGNITDIVDKSGTGAGKTLTFTYDDLNRLTVASTTSASSTPFSRTYAYNALGNITSKSDQGTYTYGETGYTNPHAVTDIGGTTLTYDTNGNLTVHGGDTYTWDYKNRLTTVGDGTATTTYAYGADTNRIKKTAHSITTIYPNDLYNKANATTTRHIYAGDVLIATIEGNGSATTTQYIHTDHLGSTNVVSDTSGDALQTLDYYPFGSARIDNGTFDEQRQFTGHEYDTSANLTYANARYYAQDVGRWTAQDPASRDNPKQFLGDPQQLNYYSYARNNPLTLFDPSGEQAAMIMPAFAPLGPAGWVIGGVVVIGSTYLALEFVDPSKLETGTLQIPRGEYMQPVMPSDPNELKPPRNNAPGWQKWLLFGIGASATVAEKYKEWQDYKEDIEEEFGFAKDVTSVGSYENLGSNVSSNSSNSYVQQVNTTSNNLSNNSRQAQINSIHKQLTEIQREIDVLKGE